jgi:4-hydroxybenzoate polyprenyltransferase
LLLRSVQGFIAFGFCASSVYLLNDLLDLTSDRKYPRKRMRPFASGRADVVTGIVLVPILLAIGIAIALTLPRTFLLTLVGYYTATLIYSLWAKRRVMVDVMLLAGLYTVRILAGAAAVSIVPSFWLLAFSMFLFLSLALVKRYSELISIGAASEHGLSGRDYETTDLPILSALGSASGYMAVLVLALYINSPDIAKLYRIPEAVWLLCPVLLFWISRVWVKAQRGEVHDDPIIFALKDRVSQVLGLIGLAIIVGAA